MEKDFRNDMVLERADQFCKYTVEQLIIELKANGFESDRMSILCLLFEKVLQVTRRNTNGYIAIHEPGTTQIKISDVLKFVSFMLFSSLTSLKFENYSKHWPCLTAKFHPLH